MDSACMYEMLSAAGPLYVIDGNTVAGVLDLSGHLSLNLLQVLCV